MKPERWREVERIFYSALEHAPNERNAFIAEACAGDPELQREVESLLACNEEADRISILSFPEDSLETEILPRKDNSSPAENDNESALPATDQIVKQTN